MGRIPPTDCYTCADYFLFFSSIGHIVLLATLSIGHIVLLATLSIVNGRGRNFHVYASSSIGNYYVIGISDVCGNKTAVEGLRQIFATYDVAKSYALFYQDIYKDQYKFRVTGIKEKPASIH